jgi:ATP-dependent DNA ligase
MFRRASRASKYEPGRRSGLWVKHRVDLSQQFVIGGYISSHLGVDSIVVGVYRDKRYGMRREYAQDLYQ